MTKSTLKINQYGDLKWCNEKGEYHRENDNPAIIDSDGHKEWWINGNRHRDNDLPARVLSDGTKEWYVNGYGHRDNDQPAVVHSDGSKEWWVNGKFIRYSYD